MKRDQFRKLIIQWGTSYACHTAAFISFLSMEMSQCTLTTMAFVWAFTVTKLGGQGRYKSRVRGAIVILWILFFGIGSSLTAVSMVADPLLHNNMCLYFSVSVRSRLSTAEQILHLLFIVLNIIMIFISIAIYCHLIKQTYASKKDVSVFSASTKPLKGFLRKILLLVSTNVLCWLPFLLVSMLSVSGYQLNDLVLGWVAVLVIPINATMNPFLYIAISKI